MRRAATAYRICVALQTLAFAAVALSRVVRREARFAATHETLPLVIAAVVLAVVAVVVAKRRIAVTWLLLQLGGACALVAYGASGEAIAFGAMLAALALMHVYSPNRFGW